MANVAGALSIDARRDLRTSIANTKSPFIESLPKVELHVHIEGTLTPALKWKFSQRNGQTLTHPRTGAVFSTLEELQDSHDTMKPMAQGQMNNEEETLSFFEAYYGGFEVLKTKRDYYDLAIHYFERAAAMNVRYCEIFFDPQGHTRTGVTWETMMVGFREASEEAERNLNASRDRRPSRVRRLTITQQVKSAWILCLLRDESPESGMEHYLASLPYRDMIVGIGLDSNEDQRPPSLFEEIYLRARADGFRLTAHCDVGKAYPIEHVHQVVNSVGGTGAERVDHGMNATDSPELTKTIRDKGVGMTICPWSYIRHQPFHEVFERIRTLFDAGIKIAIASDDPTFMEDTWIHENLLLVQRYCKFSNVDMLRLARNAVEISWASDAVKKCILDEIDSVGVEAKSGPG
jgi:adenosine deaminase